jgi:hypothetical protein
MKFGVGDRVRVIQVEGLYTGCRGTVAPSPELESGEAAPLGYYVAVDGENGVVRPFLRSELEPLSAARVRTESRHPKVSGENQG